MTLFGPLPVSFSLHLTRERLGAIAGPWLRNDFLTSRSAGLPASSDRRQRSATPVTDRQAPSELAWVRLKRASRRFWQAFSLRLISCSLNRSSS